VYLYWFQWVCWFLYSSSGRALGTVPVARHRRGSAAVSSGGCGCGGVWGVAACCSCMRESDWCVGIEGREGVSVFRVNRHRCALHDIRTPQCNLDILCGRFPTASTVSHIGQRRVRHDVSCVHQSVEQHTRAIKPALRERANSIAQSRAPSIS
jgi:hypothetical protein